MMHGHLIVKYWQLTLQYYHLVFVKLFPIINTPDDVMINLTEMLDSFFY